MPWLRLVEQVKQRKCSLQRLQKLETVAFEQLDGALLEIQNGIVLCRMMWMTLIDQVSPIRVLGDLNNWHSMSNWDFVTRACDGTINRQLSEDARITADVVSNIQLLVSDVSFFLSLLIISTTMTVIARPVGSLRTRPNLT